MLVKTCLGLVENVLGEYVKITDLIEGIGQKIRSLECVGVVVELQYFFSKYLR